MIKRITRFGPTALSALVIGLFATVAALFVGTFTNRLRAQLFPLKSFQVWYTEDTGSVNGPWESYYARCYNGDTITKNLTTGFSEYSLASKGILVASSTQTDKIMTYGSGKPY